MKKDSAKSRTAMDCPTGGPREVGFPNCELTLGKHTAQYGNVSKRMGISTM